MGRSETATEKPHAFVAVEHDGEIRIAFAFEGEAGYLPIRGDVINYRQFTTLADAQRFADFKNARLGLSDVQVAAIVTSAHAAQNARDLAEHGETPSRGRR